MKVLSSVQSDLSGWFQWLIQRGYASDRPLPATSLATWLALALATAALVALYCWWRNWQPAGATTVNAKRGFSQAEGLLWMRMSTALPGHVVLMDVPLHRFVLVRRPGGLRRDQRKFEALEVDYAVFRPDGSVCAVVLLEDGDPQPTERQRRWRQKLLERAGLRTFVWRTLPMPTIEAIRGQLDHASLPIVAAEPGSGQRQSALSLRSQAG